MTFEILLLFFEFILFVGKKKKKIYTQLLLGVWVKTIFFAGKNKLNLKFFSRSYIKKMYMVTMVT